MITITTIDYYSPLDFKVVNFSMLSIFIKALHILLFARVGILISFVVVDIFYRNKVPFDDHSHEVGIFFFFLVAF